VPADAGAGIEHRVKIWNTRAVDGSGLGDDENVGAASSCGSAV
jgi:hypothetical protein